MNAPLALLLAALAQDPAPPALRVSSAVAPDTVRVGERFRSVLQIVAPPGATVEFPALPVRDTLQPVDSVRVIPGRAGEPPIASYALVAWVAGAPLSAVVPIRVAFADGGGATYLVPLRLPAVRPVLPPPGTDPEPTPRPARGVLAEPPRAGIPSWAWALLVLFLAVVAAAAWARRLRGRARAPGSSGSPRERALAALEALGRNRTPGGGDAATLYPAATRIVRRYLAEVDARWSVDLTSAELLAGMRAGEVDASARARLGGLLQHADRVKFARHRPEEAEVAGLLESSRLWVSSFPPPAALPADREAA